MLCLPRLAGEVAPSYGDGGARSGPQGYVSFTMMCLA
jgi:hypothetical protein